MLPYLPSSSMASDYSYVKLCMTDLKIVNSGGAEVALICRHIYSLFFQNLNSIIF